MAYAFNNDKSKIDVYDGLIKTATVSVDIGNALSTANSSTDRVGVDAPPQEGYRLIGIIGVRAYSPIGGWNRIICSESGIKIPQFYIVGESTWRFEYVATTETAILSDYNAKLEFKLLYVKAS